MRYTTIFWDFNGVISHDYFYRPLQTTHPKVWDFIQSHIFGPLGGDIINRWMRADVDLHTINQLIIESTGIDNTALHQAMVTGGANFNIEKSHFPVIKRLRKQGIRVGLVTDNMDIFDLYINSVFQFQGIFDVVINSYPHRKLKKEGLFDIAMNQIGEADYSTSLLIEDSQNSIKYFQSMGGHGYRYTNFADFSIWAKNNLPI